MPNTRTLVQPNIEQAFVCCRTLPNTTEKPLPNTPGTPNTAPNMRSAEHAFGKGRTRVQPNIEQAFVCCRTLPNTTEKPLPNTPGTPNTAPNMRSAEHAFGKGRTRVQLPLDSFRIVNTPLSSASRNFAHPVIRDRKALCEQISNSSTNSSNLCLYL